MTVLFVTPMFGDVATGNVCSARSWAAQLRELGHEARLTDSYEGEDVALLAAVNVEKSNPSIAAYAAAHPERPVVVVASGTDIYPEPGPEALDSFARADRIVLLQEGARSRVPAEHQDKVRVIVQAATRVPGPAPSPESFDVCVVGHLRDAKDPMRAAAASRLLPPASRVRIRHAGAILEPPYEALVEREAAENPRYEWLGALGPDEARALVGSCRLIVLSSPHEGGARVIGEAAVAGVPVLATRNDASESLLGADYAGLFDAGDTEALAVLLRRAEEEPDFYRTLRAAVTGAAPQFEPEREREGWRRLLAELAPSRVSP